MVQPARCLARRRPRAAAGLPGTKTQAILVATIPSLLLLARGLTRNRADADDLMQGAIVRALGSLHQFKEGTSMKAWMFTIVRNLHNSTLRSNRRIFNSLTDKSIREPWTPPNQEANIEFGDLRRAFSQLGDDGRQALFLVGACGLSYDEAAELCDCARGTIKSRVSRARFALREILADGALVRPRRDTSAQASLGGNPLDDGGSQSLLSFARLGQGIWADAGSGAAAIRSHRHPAAMLQGSSLLKADRKAEHETKEGHMQPIRTDQADNIRLRFVFGGSVVQFDLAAGLTYGDIAERLYELPDWRYRDVVAIDITLGASDEATGAGRASDVVSNIQHDPGFPAHRGVPDAVGPMHY